MAYNMLLPLTMIFMPLLSMTECFLKHLIILMGCRRMCTWTQMWRDGGWISIVILRVSSQRSG